MIVVVGRYPIITLEIFSGIVYGLSTERPICGITRKTCTRERWDPDRSYDVVVKDCHAWPIRGLAYIVLVRFVPIQGLLLIRISMTLLDMSDSLFTTPLVEMHVLYDDGLKLIINDDYYY
jgi:hypothetical protein